jgi:hypothetical protein
MEPDKDPNPEIAANVKGKLSRYFNYGGAVCAIVSMLVTYQGVMQVNGQALYAALLIIASGIISFGFYYALCELLPQTSPKQRPRLFALLGAGGIPLIFATSTWIGILGMAAPEALRLCMLDNVEIADAHLEELIKRQEAQSDAIGILDAKAKEFAALAEREKTEGTFERKGEKGKAYRDLLAISGGFTAAAEALRADQARRETAVQTATKALGTLRELAQSTKANPASLRKADKPYNQQLQTLNVALAELERSALDSDVLGPVRSALSTAEVAPLKATDKEKRAKVQEASKAVETLGATAAAQVEQTLVQLRFEPLEQEPLTLPSPMDAVLQHLKSVIHLVAFPVGLDIGMPYLALVALSFMSRVPPRSEDEPNEPAPSAQEPSHDTTSSPSRWTSLGHKVAGSKEQRAAGAG